ncbi:MAG: nickel pincer cofactor biosynthesis protein LarB [Candidatus Omnitrophica bacterium]|nr:nickel pincer cofactor biosynthesis protein LarB [Candidatus Omnitrophota bacterium]
MLDEPFLRRWLRQARGGRHAPQALIEALRRLPFDNVGVARLDTHRRLRRGIPEIVFGGGKTPRQLIHIIHRLVQAGELVLVTRLDPLVFQALRRACPALRYDPVARLAYQHPDTASRLRGLVPVVTGGTSDLPVAEEAALTLQLLGSRAVRLYDVGVAGIHRILGQWRLLQRARAIIVAAGMEGALPSVVAGLVRCPVIAVPTSVGYGAGFQGLAPLLAMLNSCVPGIGVVNIDNGFGAAYLAHLINRPLAPFAGRNERRGRSGIARLSVARRRTPPRV